MDHQVSPLGGVGQREPADGTPMGLALAAARRAGRAGEVPVGAVVTSASGQVLAVAANQMISNADASAHAELVAMRMAAQRFETSAGRGRLANCDLWVTLEPCAMCAAAAGLFRVRRVLFGAYDPKGGGVEHNARVFATSPNAYQPEVMGGLREIEASSLLRDFFQHLRGQS